MLVVLFQLFNVSIIGSFCTIFWCMFYMPESIIGVLLLIVGNLVIQIQRQNKIDMAFIAIFYFLGGFILGVSHSPSWLYWICEPSLF